MTHETYMALALEEAEKGCGWVNPNPMVGAVIVLDGEIIGKGHHERYGGPHAERNALAGCSRDPAGGTLYVTLEPCCHHGKTPPCTDAVTASGIKTVVIGASDPNPCVAGGGIRLLEQHGIEVISGVLEDACSRLNDVFFHYITEGTPFVVMKYAMTLDGKTATVSGKSRWITGEAARAHVHRSRHRYSAIMAGVGTVLADDPLLTCRLPGCKNPVRVICDTNLRIPVSSKIAETAGAVRTIAATAAAESDKSAALREKGVEILPVPLMGAHIDLAALMGALGEMKIDSVLLEGGATLNAAALQSGIVHKVQAYIAPKLFGGTAAKSPVGGPGADSPDDAVLLRDRQVRILGEDILLEYRLK
ncbi:diaminohydroxyphosphoribosylaminopyrimidine deaminase / 5-amino-6-(5-phosphoribosylamino)uracil reductase [Sporobacter termitidis DSM 10068]|uniref:Riboflavin biosynthesis protein RibD n=1 Tax=Sporobacter termitidis DSM 10068 TaxID=1123282 RepID=A0A1M5XRU5_9FIRM|nr:bifunctional diaminohydroxyphosphoribosylaminopyrimidine deaminase/5-amino-6-(5-phosphoribosylamino)uracil reductase RibD [Sporobacter termitidis]SHI02545.1 diaminohydroxyphosphoribosylaminopyrimidine deaminase / 5-amino-6-(5-phosphoribosylamino)uracil reductase [Sporobacter termitidis DSM 10068]